ncbi:hypothetical protein F4X10_20150 [Candidatus Poribacteria bacterium]|nr:hypothetical protein [Candidatus Poribacteria bacterium]
MYQFVSKCLDKVQGTTAGKLIRDALRWSSHDAIEEKIEISDIAHLVRTYWYDSFEEQFEVIDRYYEARSVVGLIVEGRNRASHRPWDLDPEFTRTQLFLIAELLGKINKPNEQRQVEAIRDKLFSDDAKERLAETKERLKEMETENAKYKQSLLETKERLTDAESKNSKYEKDTAELSKQVDEKENRIKKLLKQQKEAKAQNEKSKKDLARTKRGLEKSEEAQTDYKQRLETISKELKATEKEARTAEENLKTTSNQLEEAVDEWGTSVERLMATRKLFTTATIGSQEIQKIFPSFETDSAVRILDRRGTDKRNYLVKLMEQKQSTLIYVQSEEKINELLTHVVPEKAEVIGRHNERTSKAEETEILEKLENRELIAVVSNTTFSTLASSHCVEHFVFCHLTPGLDEFFKRCEPVFASAKSAYLHLIYNDEQDAKNLNEWLTQKYPDRKTLNSLYRALRECVGINGDFINTQKVYNGLDIAGLGITELGIETGLAIFEEVGALERSKDSIKLLPFSGRKSKIHHRGEELKGEIEEIRSFQLKQPIEKIWEEILGALDIDLERYLLKSNVASGEAEVDAETVLEEEETSSYDASSIDSEVNNPNDIDDKQSVTKQPVTPSKFSGKWTMEEVRNSLSEEIRDYHRKNYPEERCNIFYRRVVEIQNLIEAEGWRLKPPKLNKESCSFQLMDKGITRVRIVFGVLLDTFLPHANLVDRNGEKIPDLSIKSNPPRIFAPITEEEAKQLERQHGCEFWGITERKIYYNIPDDITELRPVLEFAYNKHRGQ